MPDFFSLSGRTALVSGASRGIGAALAEGLARAGAQVVGVSRSGKAPDGVAAIALDLADPQACAALGSRLDFSRLDILVNAAGLSLPPGGDELERFRQTLAVDLTAPYALVQALLPLLRASAHANVINITSINSRMGFPGNPGYVAAKAGLAGLTRALAVDLAPIRVNAVAPGYVHTDMTAKSHADTGLHEQRRRHTLLGRWGKPDDMVGTVVFLASDAAAYVTGQEIYVDGGWTVNGLVQG
jgi:NAD(P)-dependent dehydrogenase (short-subunit alcohol dehydrogenase family)